jgi:hypothetical protein
LVEDKVSAQFGEGEKVECRRWVLDTDATNHMTGYRSAFSELNLNIHSTLRFGDGSVVQIEGFGTILFSGKNGERWTFVGVYFFPKLNTNIINVGQLDEIGFQTIIEGGVMKIRDVKHRLLTKVLQTLNWLYVLDVDVAKPVCLAARGSEDAWLWHIRFGHLNFLALRKLARDGMLCGLPKLEQADQVCGSCLTGKHRRVPFPHQAEYRAERALELVHVDLCGPISPATPSGSRYFFRLIDDNNRFMWLRTLHFKDQAGAAIKHFQWIAESEMGCHLRAFRTDRGGEFTSIEFAEYYVEQGVRRQLTAPYSPQQNGIVERQNQMVVGRARCLFKSKGLLGWLWGEAMTMVIYLLNQSPMRSVEGNTPFEA